MSSIICLIYVDIGDRKALKNLLILFVLHGINKNYNNFWYDYIEFTYDKTRVSFLGVIIINLLIMNSYITVIVKMLKLS